MKWNMEKTKSKVVKSKSSNVTVTKYNPMDKISRSNATFQMNSTKKRGVYVESKEEHNEQSLNGRAGNVTPKDTVKAPRRPSRGQKRFLASVLSILSKSSTGTQYPDTEEKKPRIKRATEMFGRAENETVGIKETAKRKKKYRSKILNNSNYPDDTFDVLQSKKNIVQTPSIDFSDDEEVENIKWSEFLPRLVKPDSEEIQMEKDKKLNHLLKKMAESVENIKDRIAIEGEPPTLVSENKKVTTKDPGFYNFFVDLLETTFSVYNLKSEYNIKSMLPSAVSSKVDFEMDKTVAEKLHFSPEVSRHTSPHSRIKVEPKQELTDYIHPYKPKRSVSPPPKNKKNRSNYLPKCRMTKPEPGQPLVFPQLITPFPLFTQTTSITQNKPSHKKHSKQMLLNMLKEQLSVESHPADEPQNLFEALKILAKNKLKTQKKLRFEKTPDELAECKFNSRRVFPSRKSRIKKDFYKTLAAQSSDFKKRQKKLTISEGEASNRSLEVVNINYDRYKKLRGGNRRDKTVNSYSPRSNSPTSFSPVESVFESHYERTQSPTRQHVIMTIKSLSYSRSKDFSCERDEALT